jgi:hypothetical protein
MAKPFAFREFTNSPRREIWSLLGFRNKSAKNPIISDAMHKRPSILPQNCPTFWDVTTMPASGVICELSTLDYESIAVARWMSSPPCASCLDLVSCLSWSRSLLCNSTCCVCWDLMNIEYYVKLICDLSSLCCLWSCMLSVASRYLGRVDASDSKREYLCSIVGSCL